MATNQRIESIERATYRSWSEWLHFMEGIKARELDHKTIAAKVFEELDGQIDSAGWWAQSVTVAYEQEIGRRIPGQQSDGTFQANSSRATKLGMQDLMDAWTSFAAKDGEVLGLVEGEPRISGTKNRLNWRAKANDGTTLAITSEPKKDGAASIVVMQTNIQSHEQYLEAKTKLGSILDRFLTEL